MGLGKEEHVESSEECTQIHFSFHHVGSTDQRQVIKLISGAFIDVATLLVLILAFLVVDMP